LREAFGAHAGYEVDDAGDGLFYASASASAAVTAVAQAMASLAELGISNAVPFIEAWRERDLGAARARLGEPRANAGLDQGRAMTWDQAIELALGRNPAA
jgi:hypothetical protein